MKPLLSSTIQTPLGPMIAMAEENGLVLLEFADRPALPAEEHELQTRYGYTIQPGRARHHDHIEQELASYFEGRLTQFTVPLVTPASAFQLRVWNALRQIPYGTTTHYAALAVNVGSTPAASRAVGAANGQNRIAIVIPCHRVIGANGALTGYGGGMPRKEKLLKHERQVAGYGPYPTQNNLFA